MNFQCVIGRPKW